ncbi:MAG TPA: ATP-binding domain-containing protein, partial [Limosilactobacillus pontis]|nr:ATP-binding domain-containing protein [Limosilactobacillus pontis]
EFDAVIVWNTNDRQYHGDDERQLLYTICSRAMHALTLTVTGQPTSLLAGVPADEYQLIKHE